MSDDYRTIIDSATHQDSHTLVGWHVDDSRKSVDDLLMIIDEFVHR
jgi:hypothetical protein